MKKHADASLKYLTPDNLYSRLKDFTKGMAVTKGEFEMVVNNSLIEDVEWNHMDQMHRPTIHNTYDKGIRIATGEHFAVSLTQWGKWPFFITVSDVYVAKGLFYQSLTIAGFIFLHSIISLEQQGENVKLKDEWYIASHWLFKPLHALLNKKLYKLNARLQVEDEPVRQGRYELRKQGYRFKTDVPDYYNSNLLGSNTIYPRLMENAVIDVSDVSEEPIKLSAGGINFIVKRNSDKYLIWPAVCPHEGGPLMEGEFCETKVTCPWHGLQFLAAEVSINNPLANKHGFAFELIGINIIIRQLHVIHDGKWACSVNAL